MKGYVQVYTGNGKGKTTAALGLALRAAGAGLRVFIAQFLKQGDYSEIKALQKFSDQITIEQFGLGRFIKGRPSDDDIEAAAEGCLEIEKVLKKGEHDIVVLEEANVAVSCGLFDKKRLLELIDMKPDHVEIVVTGRYACEELIERADLVTEMVEVRHYFKEGVMARTGIEK